MANQNIIENIKSSIQIFTEQVGFKPSQVFITRRTLDFLLQNHCDEIQVLKQKSGSKKQRMKVKYKVCGVLLRVEGWAGVALKL